MNTKRIPALVMLLAGSVAAIVTYINHYSFNDMLVVLILTLVVFLIIGVVIKLIFDSFHIETPDKDRVDDDGEVLDKTEIQDEEGAEGASEGEASPEDEGADTNEENM